MADAPALGAIPALLSALPIRGRCQRYRVIRASHAREFLSQVGRVGNTGRDKHAPTVDSTTRWLTSRFPKTAPRCQGRRLGIKSAVRAGYRVRRGRALGKASARRV
jgi:hypothetical protein